MSISAVKRKKERLRPPAPACMYNKFLAHFWPVFRTDPDMYMYALIHIREKCNSGDCAGTSGGSFFFFFKKNKRVKFANWKLREGTEGGTCLTGI